MSINITLDTYNYLLDNNELNDFIINKSQNIILLEMNKLINDLKNETEISKLNFINFYRCYINFIKNRISKNTEKNIIKKLFSIIKYFKNDNNKLYDILQITNDYLCNDEIYLYMFLIEIINNYEQFINSSEKINLMIDQLIVKTKNGVYNNSYHIISKLLNFVSLTHNLIAKIYVINNNIDMINISELFLDVLQFKTTPHTAIIQLEYYNFKNIDKSSLVLMNNVIIYGLETNEDNINKITSILLIKIINVLHNINDLSDFVDKYLIVINNRINDITEQTTQTYFLKLNLFLSKIKNKIDVSNEISIDNQQKIDDIVHIFNSNNNYDINDWAKYLSSFITLDKIKTLLENNKKKNVLDLQNNIKKNTHFNLNIYFEDKKIFDFSKKSLKSGTIYGIIGNNSCGKSILFQKLEQNAIDNFFNINLKKVILVRLNKYADNFTIGDDISILNHINLIEKFELSIENRITNLNYYMKYRYELLKAIIQNPDVIILDEPLINTDNVNARWLNELILYTSNITWIISSNNYEFINSTCTQNYIIQNNKLSKCDNLIESSVINNLRANDLVYPIHIKDSFSLITLENVSNGILINPFSLTINNKSRIAILGKNRAGKTNLINLLINLNKPLSGNVFCNKTVSIGHITENIIEELIEHHTKTPIEYLYWRYKKGYDKIAKYQDIINITNNDFVKLRKNHLIDGNLRLVNKLTGYRKLNDQNEFLYEISWLGLTNDNNSWFSKSTLVDMGLNTFIENKIDRFNRNSAIDMSKLTDNYLTEYLNKWEVPHITIGNLSSSEKMRFMLAATCWKNPDLIVLDEPTNYLDNTELMNLSNLIKSYPGGIIIASNNEKFARQNMNIILEIYNGSINISSN